MLRPALVAGLFCVVAVGSIGLVVGACLQAILRDRYSENRLQAGSYIHCGASE